MPAWLGIDYGLERMGLACTDPEARVVFPLATLALASCGSRKAQFAALADLAQAKNIGGIVLGWPLLADGSESETCKQIRNAARRIQRRLPVQLYFMPEELSSFAAEQDLRAAGCFGSKRKSALDQVAACRILESFLAQPPDLRRLA